MGFPYLRTANWSRKMGVKQIDSCRSGRNHRATEEPTGMAAVAWNESSIAAAGTKLHLMRAGRGRPVLVLHHETGTLDRLPFYDALAAKYDVLVPHHPGYSKSERPDWMRSVRDIAVVYRGLLSDLKLGNVALVGLGFGGWIAAEMATMAPADLPALVLAGAMGIKPTQGDILDLAVTGYVDYARAGFHDQAAFDRVYGAEPSVDQLEMWDICREMSFRIAWKPYMYSQTLPHLLGSVRTPALVVWGDDDRVVPMSAGKRYVEALPDARLQVLKGCGHCIDMEQPDALARLVIDFLGQE
jgi:pimeloyl-ACP methyl ester carboxylesterase